MSSGKGLKIKPAVDGNKLYIVLDLPLIDKNKLFTINRVYSVPIPYKDLKESEEAGSLIARYKFATEGVAINKGKTSYIELTKRQLTECTKGESYCVIKNPVYPYNTHRSCMLALINPNPEKVRKYCKVMVYYKPRLPLATQVSSGLWIMATVFPFTFSVACDEKHYSKTHKVLPPVDLIKIEPSCTAYSDYLSLPPYYQMSSQYQIEDNELDRLRMRIRNQTDHWDTINKSTKKLNWDKENLETINEVPIEDLLKRASINAVEIRHKPLKWYVIFISILEMDALLLLLFFCIYSRTSCKSRHHHIFIIAQQDLQCTCSHMSVQYFENLSEITLLVKIL